ncbi:MAG TPA: A24 family peptidase C-terminal domain-containing protein [Thermoplasmata archaeon]|nr:A24 family peptidase C-terminal domain-containing protein [Thermoplasmata archaeon]
MTTDLSGLAGFGLPIVVLLLGGFAYAAWEDLREREVPDLLWQGLGVVGFLVGYVAWVPYGFLSFFLWTVIGLFVLQHLFAWDLRLGPKGEPYADLIELVVYLLVIVIVVGSVFLFGLGSGGVPVPVVAVLVTVLFARGLFEAGILFGGADAKALMIAGLLVPMFPNPLLTLPPSVAPITHYLPFAVNVLMNSALLSVSVPIAIALRNLHAKEFHGISGFVGYSIPVDDLPRKFVWLRDPMFGEAREEEKTIETSEDDRRRRESVAKELRERGVQRVWVTPQIPFLVLMALGVLGALLAGNLLFDLIFLL